MKRILFSLDRLRQFTAAESLLLRLARWFLHQGWSVDITARLTDGEYRQQLTQLSLAGPLRLFIDNDSPSPGQSSNDLYHHYQLIWVCNGYLSARLIELMHRGELHGCCLFQHFSASVPGMGEEISALENRLAWRIMTDSPRSYAAQRLRGASGPAMRLLPLAFDDDHSDPGSPAGGTLKHILWVTQSLSPALSELTTMCRLRGVRLDVMLLAQQTSELTNQQLSQYQLVVGEHQWVARALCLGIPVCIAGQGGWHGYLTEQSLTMDSDNFFIATGGNQPDIQQYCDALINGYAKAQQWATGFKSSALQNWSLSALLPPLLDSLPAAGRLTLNDADAKEWMMVRNILAQQADDSRPLLQWLKQREISETRRAVLSAIIAGQGEVARIGVIILDRSNDRTQCENSLLSVRQQSLAAEHCILISTMHYSSLLQENEEQLTLPVDGQALLQTTIRYKATSWLVIEAGTRCLNDSLLLFAEHQLQQPGIQVCYSDILQGDSLEDAQLLLKPDCNIDLLRSQHYPGEELLVTAACIKQYLVEDAYSNELIFSELIWRVIEHSGPGAVGHLPEAVLLVPDRQVVESVTAQRREITLQHLQRCGSEGWIEPGTAGRPDQLHYPLPLTARVSIVIVTRDNQPLLRRCLDSLTEQTRWPDYELLIVDNGSCQADACDYLNQLQALKLRNLKILHWTDGFNFAAINNFAAARATGDYLLFLNNDCSFSDCGWLNNLLEIAHRPEVAVTGARQLFADQRIQHAGFITGFGSGVAEAFRDSPSTVSGYSHYLQTAQQVSALSASCLLVRRNVFDTVGGFDAQHFAGGAADIDFCLRVRQQGYLVVWTPQATLQHMGGATRLSAACYPAESVAEQQGNDALRERWQGALCQDIRYHRHFTRTGQPFCLSHRTARVQFPLPGRPLPVMMAGHVNFTGCGHYRVIQPYQLMEQQLQLEGGLIHGLPAAMEVAAIQPDILLLQMPFDPQIEETLRQYRQLSGTKIIMEYDDYFLRLPRHNQNRHKLPKDIAGQLRRTMESADHLVVSTAALASAYAGLHSDIRVAQNRLNPLQWGALTSARNQGRKPRLGWAGGNSHTGDLAILRPLIEALADEVEWVFMGMKPAQFTGEFHSGVPFDWYPQKLASLSLDLALVPLEINLFNECKSNLRLLELGACGIPVICSDIEPYRGSLPVTRVKNHFRHWMKAIREHLSSPQALAIRGETLQQAVRRDWLLTPQSLAEWQQAWLE